MHAASKFEPALYAKVVAMDAESAKKFFGTDKDPIDLGPPIYPERYKSGARVFGFPRAPKNATERAAIAWKVEP